MSTFVFPARTSSSDIELGTTLQPKFGPDGLLPCITTDHVTNEVLMFDGLLPCITTDHVTNEVLMFAFMNAESFAHTLRTGKATYWSRSRNKLWTKGEESGNVQLVKEVLTDCDQDVIQIKVENVGGVACHNGYKSCFYRKLVSDANPDDASSLKLEFAARRVVDPAALYKKK